MRKDSALIPPVAADGSPVTMRLLDPAHDIPAVCQLFTEVFGSPITEAQWRWKYQQAPGSSHYHALAVHQASGQLLGHMGVAIVPGLRGAQPIRMAHACDLMISPLARAGIGPDSIYRHIMHAVRSAAHSSAISPSGAPPLFMYGFPGQRPGTLATRLGIQRRLQICTQYTLPVQEPTGGLRRWWSKASPWRLQALTQPATDAAWSDAALNPVWQRHAQEQAWQAQAAPQAARPGLIKNAAYLRWRYLHHPQQWADGSAAPLYTLWLLQHRGQGASGWLITRQSPQPTVVDSCLPGGPDAVAAALHALPAPVGGSAGWTSWLPHPQAQAQETPIWATAMCGAAFHDDWPGPAFQPGDTDVF